MTIIFGFVRLVWKLIWSAVVVVVCLSMIFILYKGNQPMSVKAVPIGMTYFEFMADRVEAARIVRPSQCSWGMFLTLAALGPTYSALYTEIGIHQGGFWDRVSAPDSNIPKGVAGAKWYEVPHIWWRVGAALVDNAWETKGGRLSFSACGPSEMNFLMLQSITFYNHAYFSDQISMVV